ncbi:hypothetical protein I4F81_010794 [Pyropia yezoensis]|uniref:Uncharacterized protein n=1 Tax=Pyropia yezoensis TaxID=2788 RepID=A0ACC3CDL9_PYRYE|nr:hypothetical protein I4F81_010794 [Neopyropia yezoensis]
MGHGLTGTPFLPGIPEDIVSVTDGSERGTGASGGDGSAVDTEGDGLEAGDGLNEYQRELAEEEAAAQRSSLASTLTEEVLLSRLQDLQMELKLLRDRRGAFVAAANGTAPPHMSSDSMPTASTSETFAAHASAASRAAKRVPPATRMHSGPLFVASFRLQLSVDISADTGAVKASLSAGGLGLVPAFRHLVSRTRIVWLGMPVFAAGQVPNEATQARIQARLRARKPSAVLSYAPIFPRPSDAVTHQAFCNNVLWALFHYLPLSFEGDRSFRPEMFEAYKRVNEEYALALLREFERSRRGMPPGQDPGPTGRPANAKAAAAAPAVDVDAADVLLADVLLPSADGAAASAETVGSETEAGNPAAAPAAEPAPGSGAGPAGGGREAGGGGEENGVFWVHDFQLMLVPKMLRERMPHAKIGFFLHTPFPAGELYRTLPPRRELLEGMLGADLIGFHTYDYARHFLSACERILGLDIRPNCVDNHGVLVHVAIFPFGIDTKTFTSAMLRPSVIRQRDALKEELAGKKVLLGIDRLDYIKGIPHKLLAFEHFLETYPEYVGHVVLVQIATPSQTTSEEYAGFRAEILEEVGRINGRFGTVDDMPIHYREHAMSFDTLCALYSMADVAVITSLRDGMNLVSYEYIVCQAKNRGVLVLSEYTGAAQSLPGALLCNPWSVEEVSHTLHVALTMSDAERELKHKKLYRYILMHSSSQWGLNFVSDLLQYSAARRLAVEKLVRLPVAHVRWLFARRRRRLILLDYDGTLREWESQPELAEPSPRLRSLLKRLAEDEANMVFIITGRQKDTMRRWFSGLGIGFAVEHGFALQWPARVRPMFRASAHRASVSLPLEGPSPLTAASPLPGCSPLAGPSPTVGLSPLQASSPLPRQGPASRSAPLPALSPLLRGSGSLAGTAPLADAPSWGASSRRKDRSHHAHHHHAAPHAHAVHHTPHAPHAHGKHQSMPLLPSPDDLPTASPDLGFRSVDLHMPDMNSADGSEEDWWEERPESDPAVEQAMVAALAQARSLLKTFERHTPGSFVVDKESSVTWLYRDADSNFAFTQAKEARQRLEEVLGGSPLEVLVGHKILYVRPRGVNKGATVRQIVRRMRHVDGGVGGPDLLFAIGDDKSDEQMFDEVEGIREAAAAQRNTTSGALDEAAHGEDRRREWETEKQRSTKDMPTGVSPRLNRATDRGSSTPSLGALAGSGEEAAGYSSGGSGPGDGPGGDEALDGFPYGEATAPRRWRRRRRQRWPTEDDRSAAQAVPGAGDPPPAGPPAVDGRPSSVDAPATGGGAAGSSYGGSDKSTRLRASELDDEMAASSSMSGDIAVLTCTVGRKTTKARYFFDDVADVLSALEELSQRE